MIQKAIQLKMRKRNRKYILSATYLLLLALVATAQDGTTSQKPVNELPFKATSYSTLFHNTPDSLQLAAISFLKGKYLETTAANFIGHAFTGRVSGLLTTQSSGQPGADNVGFNVRGRAPIVYIDGVPRPSTIINPEQIESITVLKDALSANMMGIRSMNGAILITTKKGTAAKNYNKLNFTAQAGIQAPVKVREFLSAADYATLYNEALQNDGRPAVYSQNDIDKYRIGSSPKTHPNVNWNEELLRKNSTFTRYTLGAEGGSQSLSYFMSLDYMDQKGLLKESDANAYSTNTAFKRYLFRTNITANLSKNVSMYLNLFGRIRNINEPGAGTDAILEDIKGTPNNAYPVLNTNNTFGGNPFYTNNLYAQSTATGYTKRNFRDGFADAGFNVNLDNIIKGWYVKGLISFNTALDQTIERSKNFEVYQMKVGLVNDTTFQRFGAATAQTNTSAIDVNSRQVYLQVISGINRSFGNNNIDVLVTAYSDKTITNQDLANTFKTAAAKVTYTNRGKYIVEASGAYSGNNRFIAGEQAGFFPAAGLGWNIHKEKFLQKLNCINVFKLRATYGLTANANPGYFLFQENYTGSGSYIFGATPGSASGLALTTLPSIRTHEIGKKLNIGADIELFKNRLFISADYYKTNLEDMLLTRGAASPILGVGYPLENLGKYNYSGIELNAGYAGKVGKHFSFDVSGNIATQKSELVYNDQAAMPYSWMNQQGMPLGQTRGFIADGFVTTTGQGPVVEGYSSKPGDIKYKDLNNDGVINLYDRTGIGTTKPQVFYGFNVNMKWKGFYASLLFQGVANNEILLTGSDRFEFQAAGRAQAYPHHLNRWTPATASTATYPRLSIGNNPNNHVVSSFWLQNGDFLRLKNTEIGYNLTGKLLEKAKLTNVRIFVNGLNLFTVSQFKSFDPEMPGANYSLQKVLNTGINISF
jgi:TonB-linked SusC/RagA family outer membrane protein